MFSAKSKALATLLLYAKNGSFAFSWAPEEILGLNKYWMAELPINLKHSDFRLDNVHMFIPRQKNINKIIT